IRCQFRIEILIRHFYLHDGTALELYVQYHSVDNKSDCTGYQYERRHHEAVFAFPHQLHHGYTSFTPYSHVFLAISRSETDCSIILVSVSAVKKLSITPMISVSANEIMGPVPNLQSMTATMTVVMFPSNMAEKALLKPKSMTALIVLPERSSSFILSNMITLTSMPIPTDRTIPARPGSVSVIPVQDTRFSVIIVSMKSAMEAMSPGSL